MTVLKSHISPSSETFRANQSAMAEAIATVEEAVKLAAAGGAMPRASVTSAAASFCRATGWRTSSIRQRLSSKSA